MWLMKGFEKDNQNKLFYFVDSKTYFVNRKGGDVTLSNDQSISRQHAQLILKERNCEEIELKDSGSKYGTFLINAIGEKEQLNANDTIILTSGAIVQFGLQWNVWRLECIPFVVCPSTLTGAEKLLMKETISKLNGEVVNDWSPNVTHLTMNRITLTVKVVCALGYGKPIVNIRYWPAVLEAVEQKKCLPSYEDFIPPLAEKVLNKNKVSFSIDKGRRKLFVNKIFVASTHSQKQRILNMVSSAGGKVIEWSEENLKKEQLLNPSYIMMKPNVVESQTSQIRDDYLEMMNFLMTRGTRAIAESEIGISVVYCSTEKYCNAQFNFNSNLLSDSQTSIACPSMGSCLVPETPEMEDLINSKSFVVPESCPIPTPADNFKIHFDNTDEETDDKLFPAPESNTMHEVKSWKEPNVLECKMDLINSTCKSEAMFDISRDVFAAETEVKPSTSKGSSINPPFSFVSSSKKRPHISFNDDNDENIFNFLPKKSKKSSSVASLSTSEANDEIQLNSTACIKTVQGNVMKFNIGSTKPSRPCDLNSDENLFLFPSDKKSCLPVKRRMSLLEDEADSWPQKSYDVRLSKRPRRKESEENSSETVKSFSIQPSHCGHSWSQEIEKVNDQITAVGFISRESVVKIEMKDEDESENKVLNVYEQELCDKAVVKMKKLIKPRSKSVEVPACKDDGPNFKKFKKNKYPHINVTKIIGKSSLKQFNCTKNQDAWGNLLEINEEKEADFALFENVRRRCPIKVR